MTLHINEVSIRMRVQGGGAPEAGGERAGAEDGSCGQPLSDAQVEQIVTLTTRRVLAALRTLRDR
ncbi:DUF5908 family protein [Novispirillum itersonii]|uniref:Uncharacterized protein n=1 Tax=Novispirillum itersonii TaxID=189 RepID=A0A7W9ZJF2_NOVIT|nr:DUF5908 family protein [Novispirillum itersonii]MBB6212285.1 hypothetical protein [Novispirillum itersonii]